eukprot:6157946-Pleurochrysis_carterae.AAC.1
MSESGEAAGEPRRASPAKPRKAAGEPRRDISNTLEINERIFERILALPPSRLPRESFGPFAP